MATNLNESEVKHPRPVVLLGLFKDDVAEYLISSFPHKFGTCVPVKHPRPVVLLGLFKDDVAEYLISSFPHKFGTCVPDTTRPRRAHETEGDDYHFVTSREQMEKDIHGNELYLEAGLYHNELYGTTYAAVRKVAEQGKHCVLFEGTATAVERLEEKDFNPIAILIKPKSEQSAINIIDWLPKEHAKITYEETVELEEDFGEYLKAVVEVESRDTINEMVRKVILDQDETK